MNGAWGGASLALMTHFTNVFSAGLTPHLATQTRWQRRFDHLAALAARREAARGAMPPEGAEDGAIDPGPPTLSGESSPSSRPSG
jgi:hypothetical protein